MISFIRDEDKAQLAGLLPEELLADDRTSCICSFFEDAVNGILVSCPTDAYVWDIPFIFVEDSARRNRIASDMLSLLTLTLKPLGVSALTLSFMAEAEENELLTFAEHNGFFSIEASTVYEVALEDVRTFFHKTKKASPPELKTTALSRVPKKRWNAFLAELETNRLKKGEIDKMQVYWLPHEREVYDGELSRLLFDEHGAPIGAILIRVDDEDNHMIIDYLVNFRQGESQILLIMFREAYLVARARFPDLDATIGFHSFNPQIKILAQTLLKDAVTEIGRAVYMEKKI